MSSLCVSEHTRVHVYKHVCICVYACSPLISLYVQVCIFQHVGVSVNSRLRICTNVLLLFLPDLSSPFLSVSLTS